MMAIGDRRTITICSVPYEMIIVEGGVLFADRSGFYGVEARYMFEFRCELWYLIAGESTFDKTPLCHLVAMHKQLAAHIGKDHEQFDPSKFQAQQPQEPTP